MPAVILYGHRSFTLGHRVEWTCLVRERTEDLEVDAPFKFCPAATEEQQEAKKDQLQKEH